MAPLRSLFFLLLCGMASCTDDPALASDLNLTDFDGRVQACAEPLVLLAEVCTCAEGWFSLNSTCTLCLEGSFKAEIGEQACSACPAHTTSFQGATNAGDCLCISGYSNVSIDLPCESCALGTYKSFVGNNSCVVCPQHSQTINVGSESLQSCLCKPGYVESAGREQACEPCPQHTYTTQLGMLACTSCPVNSGSDSEGSILEDCQCNAGYTRNAENTCTACESGKYKIARNEDNCTTCPAHMSSLLGATLLLNCTCTAGFEKHTENTCISCTPDAYCPGQDERHAGPTNSKSPAGSTAINACTCLPGFFRYYDETCIECSVNHFCVDNTRVACPNNSSSAVMSVSIDNCTCSSGFRPVYNDFW